MELPSRSELASVPDLRHRLRQLRWFRATFLGSAEAVTEAYGLRFDINQEKLARTFFDWIETMEAQKRFARIDRADFIVFAAGLVLCELIRQGPAKALSGPAEMATSQATPDAAAIIRFWPEGFLYTNYCVSAISTIFEQEFGRAPDIDACADDLRTWWSYRENTAEIPASAVAFLDRFLGAEPNWVSPDCARSRQAMLNAIEAQRAQTAALHLR